VTARKFLGESKFSGQTPEGKPITISAKELDLYLAGFPCSPFSSAGKREGFEAHMATCFKYVMTTIKSVRPRGFILENVPGVLGKANKPKLDAALDWMRDLYDIEIYRTNSDRYDLPQDRERVYFIGLRKDAKRAKDSLAIVLRDIGTVEAGIKAKTPAVSWDVWLKDKGLPAPQMRVPPSPSSSQLSHARHAVQTGFAHIMSAHVTGA
jgi:site-specific DNA-cytosine methylase